MAKNTMCNVDTIFCMQMHVSSTICGNVPLQQFVAACSRHTNINDRCTAKLKIQ